MPLVNVVPHVVLHQKTHVLVSENFFGRLKGVAAPYVLGLKLYFEVNFYSKFPIFWALKYRYSLNLNTVPVFGIELNTGFRYRYCKP